MRNEHVFTVEGATAVPATPVTLSEAGLRERQHLQAWVLEHPQIIGDDVMIIGEELGRWTTGSGERDADRLDVLALDTDGRLVVAELKRGEAPLGVLTQVLNYAARASRFSLDELAEEHARFCGPTVTPEEAAARLREHAPDVSDESLALGARCVVLAGGFPAAVTNTALYLHTYGVPLTLLTFDVYRTAAGHLVLTTSQLLPVPDTEEFMVRPRSGAETRRAVEAGRQQRRGQLAVLLELLDDGEPLTVVVPPRLSLIDGDAVQAWLDADPARARVAWCGDEDPRHPVEWTYAGTRYTLKGLAQAVVEAATGRPRAKVWGPNWLRHDGTDRNLVQLLRGSAEGEDDGTPVAADDEDGAAAV